MHRPTHVRLDADGIHIAWDDGHGSRYPHRLLRGQCPCAACVQEMTGVRMVFESDVPEDVGALDWMQVGNYALQFLWSDEHMTGIYSFEYLRRLCPCGAHAEPAPPG